MNKEVRVMSLLDMPSLLPHGEGEVNTSDSERPIAIGGAESNVRDIYLSHFITPHLAIYIRAITCCNETIQYSGSPLKYSISEENHNKGFFIVNLDGEGKCHC